MMSLIQEQSKVIMKQQEKIVELDKRIHDLEEIEKQRVSNQPSNSQI